MTNTQTSGMGVRSILGVSPSSPGAHCARRAAVWREGKGEWGTEGARDTGLQRFCGRDNPHAVGQPGPGSCCPTTWRQKSPKAAGAQSHRGHVGEERTTPTLPEAGAAGSVGRNGRQCGTLCPSPGGPQPPLTSPTCSLLTGGPHNTLESKSDSGHPQCGPGRSRAQ